MGLLLRKIRVTPLSWNAKVQLRLISLDDRGGRYCLEDLEGLTLTWPCLAGPIQHSRWCRGIQECHLQAADDFYST